MKVTITIDVSPPLLHIVLRTDQYVMTLDNQTRNPLGLLVKLLQDIVYTQCERSNQERTNRLYVRTLNAFELRTLWQRNTRRRARKSPENGL